MSTPPVNAPARGAVELFAVSFASAMSDDDLASLVLAMDFPSRAGSGADAADRVGPARLDHYSGVFLKAGTGEGQWVLHARTWGQPSPESVHRWHVMAAGAALRLDPTVSLPERWHDDAPEIPDRPVGHVANKRFAALRRRLAGVR